MNLIKYTGKIHIDPEDFTNKHKVQKSWKKVSMIMFEGEMCEYYSWFISRRYNLTLNKPLRGAHISFINDSIKDLRQDDTKSLEDVELMWKQFKNKYDDVDIEIELDVDARSNGEHWWLKPSEDSKIKLQNLRTELGLGNPYWNFHLSIGHANEKNIAHSEYIVRMIENKLITT